MMRRAGPVLAVAILTAATWSAALAPPSPPEPEGADRPADQTFLTFPEWFLVFSPDEYARFIASRPPSDFPYVGHIGQLWESYAAVTRATREYPFNAGYHVMIVVIATSQTVEYAVKGGYEALVGRLTEVLRASRTPEDDHAARIAREYVEFIEVRPWYEFDFVSPLRGLWSLPLSLDGNTLRACERRYTLTTEWLAKAAYGALIAKGTGASYAKPWPKTRVALDALPAGSERALPEMRVLSTASDGALVDLPRYKPFTLHASELARRGARFRKVAGNSGPIALSAFVGNDWAPRDQAPYAVLFAQPTVTHPGQRRVVLTVPVGALGETLRELDRPGIAVEHVFDY